MLKTMAELIILDFFLGVAFVLAPLFTKKFFLNDSKTYSDAHKTALIILLAGAIFHLDQSAWAWPLFCVFGFSLYLKNEFKTIFSVKGLASCIPFVFSLISAVWFMSGVLDLHLLGYDRAWSFYAALHGAFLGWMFVGGLVVLSKRSGAANLYLAGCFICLIGFLLVAFGIDGVPVIKRLGVVALSLTVPFLIGLFAFESKNRAARIFSSLSLGAIAISVGLALLNEFWANFPKVTYGLPTMVLAHGFLNAVFAIPFFGLALWFEFGNRASQKGENVLFFDDVCVLCNGTVLYLIGIDKNRNLRFSALQGEYAKTVLEAHHTNSVESVVFWCNGETFVRSEAVIQVLKTVGGVYRWAGRILSVLPTFLLDVGYRLVAKYRYRIFGKNETCMIPAPDVKSLFIP